jgi:hypothetical protein
MFKNNAREPIRSMPLYSMAMPEPIIIITEAPFVSTLVRTIGGVRSRPQTPKGTKFVGLHEDIPKEVNKAFVS